MKFSKSLNVLARKAVVLTFSVVAIAPNYASAETVKSTAKPAKSKSSGRGIAQQDQGQQPTAQPIVDGKIFLHSLNGIDLDQWTKALWNRDVRQMAEVKDAQDLVDVTQRSQSAGQLYTGILASLKKQTLASANDYHGLADKLFTAKQITRLRTDLENSEKRRQLFLLEMMAEEALYVGHKLYPNELTQYTYERVNKKPVDDRHAILNGIQLRNGDILISKATGSGSSSFIAISMDGPNIYSHSTPVYIEPGTNRLMSPEAFIEDGVKLRDLRADYIDKRKTRLSAYRFTTANRSEEVTVRAALDKSLDTFVKTMYTRLQLPETTLGPTDKPAYAYDFGMNPLKADNNAFFCSGVAYNVYDSVFPAYPVDPKTSAKNPYAVENWSTISGGRASLYDLLNVKTDAIPAPTDLELNRHFELVASQIAIDKLQQDRIEFGILDAFMQIIANNPEAMQAYATKLDKIGNETIKPEQIAALQKANVLPIGLNAKLGEVPTNANLKQLIFFYYMNEIMTPKLRDKYLALENQALSAGENARPFGPIEIRSLVTQEVLENIKQIQTAATQIFELKAKAVEAAAQKIRRDQQNKL